jgi:2-polyprenyl-3-methyl-5-hydroxy-6-metoxy-1,4-benzoquinol methylase
VSSAAATRHDWDKHWDEYAETASSNPAQRFRRRLVLDLLHLGSAPSRVLDLGCGQGDLIADLHRINPNTELCGIDVSESGIEIARKKVPTARFFSEDLARDDEPPEGLKGWATHAVCSEVLEHVDDPGSLMRHAAACLARGCRMVVTVPGGPMSAFDRHIGHRRHFKPDELGAILTSAGYELERVDAAGFPQFNLYRLMVIQRGERLVHDVSSANKGLSATAVRAAMAAFRAFFALGTIQSRWGWQTVAVAHTPGGTTPPC